MHHKLPTLRTDLSHLGGFPSAIGSGTLAATSAAGWAAASLFFAFASSPPDTTVLCRPTPVCQFHQSFCLLLADRSRRRGYLWSFDCRLSFLTVGTHAFSKHVLVGYVALGVGFAAAVEEFAASIDFGLKGVVGTSSPLNLCSPAHGVSW